VRTLQSHGLKVLGDAVLNHRCATYQGPGGVWNQFGGKMTWDERAIVGAPAAAVKDDWPLTQPVLPTAAS
jgi:hypothetical protein